MDTGSENTSREKPEEEFVGHNEAISSLKKRHRKGRKKQYCRPVKTPFNPENFAEFVLKLDKLKNLDWRDPSKHGQYVIRASCMGKVYGHFLSGVVDMAAYVTMSRTPHKHNPKDGWPDIDISETIVFHVLYKELIDNPVVLTLLDGRRPCKGGVPDHDFSQLTPIGYMCLDMLELVNNEIGFIDEYIEPWLLPHERKVEKLAPLGVPQLNFSVSCSGGLPEAHQLRSGNSISLYVESMHRLPEEVLQVQKFKNELNVFITLPVLDSEQYLLFPRGQVHLDESHHHHKSKKDKHCKPSKNKDTTHNKHSKYPHWASVLEHWPEIPKHTTIIPGPIASDDPDYSGELSGDMPISATDDHWQNHLNSTDPKIVWDSLHRIYMPAVVYKKMLEDVSKNSTWPLEVAITINKEISKKSVVHNTITRHSNTSEEHSSQSNAPSVVPTPTKRNLASASVKQDTAKSSEGSSQGTQPQPPLSSGPKVDEPHHYETIIVYHGIAFFDLTQLLNPGTKTIRFASRLHPYKEKLLLQKTSIKQSAFLSSIPGYLIPGKEDSKTAISIASLSKPQQSKKPLETPKGQSQFQFKEKPGGLHGAKSAHHGHHGHEKDKDVDIKALFEAKTSKEILDGLASSGESTTNFKIETSPFIVFELKMDHPIVPLYNKEDAAKSGKEYTTNNNSRPFPRRRVMNARMAQVKYRRAILQASAELCEEFHRNYLEEVVNDPKNSDLLDPEHPASACDALKKGFLLYLNATGRYVIIREHLRHAISHIIQQRCLNLRPNGFQTPQEFQSYLHDMYIYLVDQMHDILSKTQMNEVDPFVSISRLEEKRKPEKEFANVMQTLCNYAEEALAQGDFDNCHRIHLERICKSDDDPDAWVEFAVMWLSRGDDRMAEIAVREALRINPEHIYALLMGGIIAAKHEDDRAIDCIGSALSLHPTSPECMVILAMVYKMQNNDVAADYYFKYGRYVHRLLTGGDTNDMDKEYRNLDSQFTAFTTAPDGSGTYDEILRNKEKDHLTSKSEQDRIAAGLGLGSANANPKSALNDPRLHKVKKSSNSKMDTHSLRVHSHVLKRVPSVGHSTVDGSGGHKHHHRNSKVENVQNHKEDHTEDTGADFATKRDSISNKSKSKRHSNSFTLPHVLRPNFQFDIEFGEEALRKVLPLIIPSIQTPWDITQTVVTSPKKQMSTKKFESLRKESVEAEAEKHEHHESEVDPTKSGSGESEGPGSFKYDPADFMSQFEEMYGEEFDLPDEHHGHVSLPPSPEVVAEGDFDLHLAHVTVSEEIHKTEDVVHNSSPPNIGEPEVAAGGNEHMTVLSEPRSAGSEPRTIASEPTRQKFTSRSGSEYIWTAQLLLQLRLFDLMDGVLAREVHLNEKRNIQYLYLRAMSLYLRQRSADALVYINEALELDPLNASLWALKGHCYYRIKKHLEAIESYEKALTLPHDNQNQHLVYLRFGSLCLDQGGEDSSLQLAKKIFQRGVHMYPSPYMWLAYGNTCYQLHQYEESENAFSEANRIDNTSPLIWGHLALVSLACNNKALAEQSYKWAIRFGLKKGPMVDEIHRLQKEKGFGDPSFPRVPNCLPHDFYLRRVGRQLPFDMYKEALIYEPPARSKKKYYDTEREMELKRRLEGTKRDDLSVAIPYSDNTIGIGISEGEEDDIGSERDMSVGQLNLKRSDKKKKLAGNKKHEDTKSVSVREKRKTSAKLSTH